ncbi:MAG: HNH endonuclease [Myxococcales bacterium]|nr:HNH endonuclease [Myxococcales bacterium]
MRDGTAQREGRQPSRYVPVEVRRQVWQRDAGRCAFVGAGGRRCNSRHRLEIHHLKPFAHGGEATPDNLMLACKRHNSHCARLDFGEELMARFQKTG